MIDGLGALAAKADKFKKEDKGGATLQAALLFGGVAMALSVLIAPQLKSAVDTYAENRALGIDKVITGSIKPTRQITVRKSVLDK